MCITERNDVGPQSSFSKKSNTQMVVVYGLILLGAFIFSFPFLWMVSTAIKPLNLTMKLPPQIWGFEPQFENFKKCLNYENFKYTLYARNTLYVCLLTVLGTVLSSSLVAYGFSRIRWRGRDTFFIITLATMMIPFPVVMIPLYSVFRTYGWVGSFKPLWIPAFFAGAFNIFLLRQFFMTIPHDLTEAAVVDGAGDFRIYWQIILPLAKPALLVVALFQFMVLGMTFLDP